MQEVIKAVVGFSVGAGAVLAICWWVVQRYLAGKITQRFAKELETAQQENRIALERFKADLLVQHKQAEIAFSAYHSHRFQVAKDLYASLQRVNQLAHPRSRLRAILKSGPISSDELRRAYEELQVNIEGISLFLNDDTMRRLAEILHYFGKMNDLIEGGDEEEATRFRNDEVVPKIKALREEFRKILQEPK